MLTGRILGTKNYAGSFLAVTKPIKVKCPQCLKSFEYYSSLFRPFCCEQCRLIDLGQWLDGSYGVPATKLSEEEQAQLEGLAEGKLNEEE